MRIKLDWIDSKGDLTTMMMVTLSSQKKASYDVECIIIIITKIVIQVRSFNVKCVLRNSLVDQLLLLRPTLEVR